MKNYWKNSKNQNQMNKNQPPFVISSFYNEHVKQAFKLHQSKFRKMLNQFLAINPHVVTLALRQQLVQTLFVTADYYEQYANCSCQVLVVNAKIMVRLANMPAPQGLVAVCKQPVFHEQAHHYLILDSIQNPNNLGAIIRSAVAFGFTNVLCSPSTVDPFHPQVLNSSQGYSLLCAFQFCELLLALKRLKQKNYIIINTNLKHDNTFEKRKKNLDNFKAKYALILGNEGQGVSEELTKISDFNYVIKMDKVSSLNVAVAAGIIMYNIFNY